MARCNPKVHVGKCLERIDSFLSSYVKGTNSQAWKDKFIDWLTPELLTLAKKHGIPIRAGPGGEGVAEGQIVGNGNQSLLPSKNPQYAKPADGQRQEDWAVDSLPEIPAGGVIKLDDGGKQAPLPGSRFATKVVAKADPRLPCYDPRPVVGGPTVTVVAPEPEVETETVGARATVMMQAEEKPVQTVIVTPDWPAEARLYIEGYCLNPRLMAARLYEEEGGQKFRRVSVWKDRSGRLKPGMKVACRLDKGGATPVYMVV